MRIEIGAADDHDRIDQLLEALGRLGATGDSFEIGMGLNEFFVGGDRLTIYRDAWMIDLEGPDETMTRLINLLSSPHTDPERPCPSSP